MRRSMMWLVAGLLVGLLVSGGVVLADSYSTIIQRTVAQAGLASSPTANAAAAGVDVTIPAAVGQLGVCVQNRDSAGIVCVGGWGGTGVLCDEAVALNAAAVDGQAGGAVCLPTTAAITVGANVANPLDFVWWRI